MNDEGAVWDDGYAWWYGGEQDPYWGALAESYRVAGGSTVCGIELLLTQNGGQGDAHVDLYIWNSVGNGVGGSVSGQKPGTVLLVCPDQDPGVIDMWPTYSVCDFGLGSGFSVPSTQNLWVGYWGRWANEEAQFYCMAAVDAVGGILGPRTNIYPTGWHVPWNHEGHGIKAFGIGAWVMPPGPRSPRKANPFSATTWGAIKELYK